jgi:hypothetical protein
MYLHRKRAKQKSLAMGGTKEFPPLPCSLLYRKGYKIATFSAHFPAFGRGKQPGKTGKTLENARFFPVLNKV